MCPSTDDWVNKMWYIHTMKYCSGIKRNEILIYATTWMDLINSVLNEISQTWDKYYMILLITST